MSFRLLLSCCVGALLCACSSNMHKSPSLSLFHEIDGVTLVDDSCCIYQYKDTLYYFNEISDFLFKIPEGFTYSKSDRLFEDGIRLSNADSTMNIYLASLSYGYPRENYSDEPLSIALSNYACDNSDIKMYYEVNDSSYLKVGFGDQNIPMLEKCIVRFDNDKETINEFIQFVRFEYLDFTAKEAENINFFYIQPWPNNFYK